MPEQRERSRKRKRSRNKKPSKRAANVLYNLGWLLAAVAVGLPLLALTLYLLGSG